MGIVCSHCPCRNCELRTENCHSRCRLYIDWAGNQKWKKEEERKTKRDMWEACNRRRDAIHACMKKNGGYKK